MAEQIDHPVCIITGGNTGLGYEAAKRFLKEGYHVILACRSKERGISAVHSLLDFTTSYHLIEYMALDLNNRESISNFCQKFQSRNLPLKILLNNAAVYNSTPKPLTEDKIDQALYINYYGLFLLTQLLIPILESSAPSRIVNVSSALYKTASFELDQTLLDPCGTLGLEISASYPISKLRGLMFSAYLSNYVLIPEEVSVVSLCPGFIPTTELVRDTVFYKRFILNYIFPFLPFTSTQDQGVERIFTASTCSLDEIKSEKCPSALLYEKDEWHTIVFDNEELEKLWKHSLEVVGL